MIDPWMSRAMAHDALWVRLEAQLAAVAEAALAEVLAKLWRLVLGERPAVVAAAAQPPALDGIEQAAADTWNQALARWLRPILFAAYADKYENALDAAGAPQGAFDDWWAATLARLAETADKVILALREEVAAAPTESIDKLRDRIARVLSLDAATKTIRDRIEDVEDQLASVRLSRSQLDELLARRVRLQAELFRTQASQARSKAYLALAQALPEDADQFRDLARQAARSAGDQGRLDRELSVVDNQLYPGDSFAVDAEREKRDQLAALKEDAAEDSETWRNKARLIARTESTNVLNEATLQAGLDAETASKDELIKVWLSSRDERVRPTHAPKTGAHGQTQPLSQPFRVGEALLQRPGDPDGPPGEVINCRCTISVLTREEHEEIAAVLAAATVEEAMTSPGEHRDELPIGFRGPFAPLDRPTGDGRQLATPPGGVRFRQEPWPLLWQPALADGHDGAVVVGKVAKFWVEDGMVWGQGPYDLDSKNGREAARLHAGGFINGLSIDPDDVTAIWDEENEVAIYTDWRIMGGTLLPYPAFDEARIEPIYASDLDLTLVASLMASGAEEFGWEAGEKLYRGEWFDDPKLTEWTPLQIGSDGQVYGHIADWTQCHIAIGDRCQLAPRSKTGYAYFHLGEILTDRGPLPIGKLTVGGGHANGKWGYAAAAHHYDNVATAVCVVRAYEDQVGIAVAGQVIHDVGNDKVAQLRMCPPSGDWRPIGGGLEMIAALGVNTPGFPIPRETVVMAGGNVVSLVAAGMRPPLSMEEQVAGEVRAALRREEKAQQLALRVGLDPRSRAKALAASAHINEEA